MENILWFIDYIKEEILLEFILIISIGIYFSRNLFFTSTEKSNRKKFNNIFNKLHKDKNGSNRSTIKNQINSKLSPSFKEEFISKHKLKNGMTDFIIYSLSGFGFFSYSINILKSIFNGNFSKWIWYLKERSRISSSLRGSLFQIIYFEHVRENGYLRKNIGLTDLSMFRVRGLNGNTKAFLGSSQDNMESIIYFYLHEMYKLEKFRTIILDK